MTGCNFFDTNIVFYAHTDTDSVKKIAAKKLIDASVEKRNAYISVQVIEEFINNIQKKAKLNIHETTKIVTEFMPSFEIISLTPMLAKDAMRISERYQFSIWDSFIVAAALYAQCSTLYTEDLQNSQVIDGVLTVRNPFIN
jgi:predicted nucleic acid-binding protein